MMAQAVEATEEDFWVLDTILPLVVTFVLATAQLLALAPPAAW